MSEDRPLYAAKPPGDPLPTNAEIAERLRTVAHEMRDIGMTMDYVGGFGDVGIFGRMLMQMAQHPMAWSQMIEKAKA